MPSEELLPCPFCGGEARLSDAGNGIAEIECVGCDYATVRTFGTDAAIEAWNTRAERTCMLEPCVFEDGAFTHMVIKCSNCGLRLEPEISGKVPSFVNYCPNCGARVTEVVS